MNGLITRDVKDYDPTNSRSAILGGNTILVKWSDIEPTEGQIDPNFLEHVRSFGTGINLRILGGASAPTWLNVPTFTYNEGVSGRAYDMPYWWTERYMSAWEVLNLRLENMLGVWVDTIHLTGGGTLYAEPFIRSVWANRDTLPIGIEEDQAALLRMHKQQTEAWPYGYTALSVHPWQGLSATGTPISSLPLAVEHALAVKPTYVGAHNLRENPTAAMLAQWDAIKELPFKAYFQTANPTKIDNWVKALDRGMAYEPVFIELNRDLKTYSVEAMVDFIHQMKKWE